ncbi:MAG: CinA family nicotinamide mononucleotide deamidase-related protein, partial [Acidobacteria bacterium]|nr:CinA family nicotinamide mononucleotide deamidase-related protein [Acidobacteriota bacterium]
MLNAEILAIGSEMLTPFRIDTNSLWLTEQLNALGVEIKLKTIIGDDEARLEETIRDAMKRSEIVISTGGLGPTEDDITKKVFARVLGRELAVHEPTLEAIRARFARRGMEMPANNVRQAMLLTGAELLVNNNGTAPGQLVQQGDCTVVLLPGPPREMKPMFTDSVAPVLRQRVGELFILRRQLKVYGLSESKADELAAPLYLAYQNPTTTILAKNGQIEFHLTAQARVETEAAALLDELAAKMKAALGDYVYAEGDATLEETVGNLLRTRGATLATAESCTGGLLAGRLTEVPGSSDYFIS